MINQVRLRPGPGFCAIAAAVVDEVDCVRRARLGGDTSHRLLEQWQTVVGDKNSGNFHSGNDLFTRRWGGKSWKMVSNVV
jgi:hypothetical protein